jgi:hypothetical protein
MPHEQPDKPIRIDSWRNRWRVRRLQAAGLFTIDQVADACRLPQPVVAQLVPRTRTAAGWMYTAEQLAYAVQIARPCARAATYRHHPSTASSVDYDEIAPATAPSSPTCSIDSRVPWYPSSSSRNC